jgi:KUP system potassium uptake protein
MSTADRPSAPPAASTAAAAAAPASGPARASAPHAGAPLNGAHAAAGEAHVRGGLLALSVGAIGIVFGDIGTSPLYAFQECIAGPHRVPATEANVLGILSLFFWSMTMVVTFKYLALIMRADNRGEGGILALLALAPERIRRARAGAVGWVALLVLAGAGLLFGDGIITPAISVLSAMEGLGVASARLHRFVVPLTCAVLFGLFAIQKRGTGSVGRLFGPVMVVWFLIIGALGAMHIAHTPRVLAAVSPHHAARLFAHAPWKAFKLLGSVVLCVTGGEALYADMGHFGRRPIRVGWLTLVFPSLLLCYFGQGALVIARPGAAANVFYNLVPAGTVWTYALVGLAAPATVIASQALISGVFSLTHQAIRLGYFPRLTVRHTSDEAEGQIYVPAINWGLAGACLLLVLGFQESSRLAAAYGLAVTGTMGITSVVFYVVVRQTWKWSAAVALPILLTFLAFDLPFFAANLLKFFDGGYIPFVVGALLFAVMVVWKRGRSLLSEYYATRSEPLAEFLAHLSERIMARTPGVAVFMASSTHGVPPVLGHVARRIRALHETVVLLTVNTEHRPHVPAEERLESAEALGNGFFRVVLRYGFTDEPRVPEALSQAVARGAVPSSVADAEYFLGRETFLATSGGRMGALAEEVFGFFSRNARSATAYFGIAPEQVVEIGTQIDL